MDLTSAPPTALGKYEIRGVLGRGAMGTVYDGWDPVIGRRVAIKTVRLLDHADPEAQEGLERFKREAQAAGRLSHPNIVGVYDYGETAETAYIVMEFVEGQSLKQHLDAGERFPVAETVAIMGQVLAGLQFSHDSGVIHRDVKPGNVMITKGGPGGGRVKLADFGIARIESSVMTQDGTMLGTPAYMSPEQLMAQTVDSRTDIYSAGVVLYQLLTGERPFEGGLTAIIHKALNTVPPRPSELSVTAPASLDRVVARAMSKRPADRYPDADSFANDMRAAFEAPGQAIGARVPMADADATVVARPGLADRAAPPPAPPARSVAPSPPVLLHLPPPLAKAERGSNKALWGSLVVIALLAVGGGAWWALRSPAPPETIASAPSPAGSAPSGVSPVPSSGPPVSSPPAATPPRPAQPPAAQSPPAETQSAQSTPAPMPPTTSAPAQSAPPSLPPSGSPSPPAVAVPPVPAPIAAPPAQSKAPEEAAPKTAAIVPPKPAAIREALAALALSANCALPRFALADDGGITATGLVGAGAPAAALHEATLAAVGSAQLSWLMRPVDPAYCAVLNLIRPLDQPMLPAFGLALKDETEPLKDGEAIRPVLKLPDFPAHLQVDYLSHDGSVLHLFPDQAHKDKLFPANAIVPLGDPKQGVGTVGPPFGTDLIIAIASSVPLFSARRGSDADTVQAYLPALAAALDAARRNNVKLIGRALPVETMAR